MTDLDELERLEREATKAPWFQGALERTAICIGDKMGMVLLRPGNVSWTKGDAAFISALRSAARELIADVRRYRLLKSMYFAADFAYKDADEKEHVVLLFKLPDDSRISADLDASLDGIAEKMEP